MSLSQAYGTLQRGNTPPRYSNWALDLGYDFFDTAALYGFGANEELLRKAIGRRENKF